MNPRTPQWSLWVQTFFMRREVGAREKLLHPQHLPPHVDEGGDGGLTHRRALSTTGSFRTSHTSRTLGRKEGERQ